MSKLEDLAKVLNTRDGEGYELHFDPSTGKVHFKPKDHHPKFIGEIVEEEGLLVYRKGEREEHIYRKTTAWSINNEVLKRVDRVVYTSQKAIYRIDRETAYKFGEFSQKNETQLDLKVLVPIRYWEQEQLDVHMSAEDRRIEAMGYDWYQALKGEFDKDYLKRLNQFIALELETGIELAPKMENVFNAYKLCQPVDIKVVILGQDPYHTPGVAHGLAFSTQKPQTNPPSLKNILKEVERDVYEGFKLDQPTDLTHWAEQGVFLLNTVLTVRLGEPASHANLGWEMFTLTTLQHLAKTKENIVYLFWGKHAEAIKNLLEIDETKNLVLTTTHPSPFSASKGFNGCGHFSATNEYLKKTGQTTIKW